MVIQSLLDHTVGAIDSTALLSLPMAFVTYTFGISDHKKKKYHKFLHALFKALFKNPNRRSTNRDKA